MNKIVRSQIFSRQFCTDTVLCFEEFTSDV